MDEKSDGVDEENCDNLSSKSDSEVVKECEKEMQDILEWDNMEIDALGTQRTRNTYVEKRIREESEDSNIDDGFTPVIRSRAKRLNRNNSNNHANMSNTSFGNGFEVCITSLQILPKQMALAKLLKAEKIEKILRIKYKSPYKVLVQVQDEKQAEALTKCPKLIELGYRCQRVSELSVSYGVIKGVDLEMEEHVMKEVFECNIEIVAIKRLKRLNAQGKWVNSETVRLCFNNPTIPEFILAYGCRIKVEKYVFPVTQCSGCWKFGHLVKFCPTKKIKCPKCGGEHNNCETKDIICLNCKGNHIVLDKLCPYFLKEKKIRTTMSEHNVTYRKALEVVTQEKKDQYNDALGKDNTDSQSIILPTAFPTWANRVSGTKSTTVTSHKENTDVGEEVEGQRIQFKKRKKKTSTKKNKETTQNLQQDAQEENQNSEDLSKGEEEEDKQNQSNKKKRKFQLQRIINKFKEIFVSNLEFEEKMLSVFKIVYVEFKSFLMSILSSVDCIQPILRLLYG